jgi:hypothetical protein
MNNRKSLLLMVMSILLALLIADTTSAGSQDRIDCNIQKAPCVRMTGSGMDVEFDVAPHPVKAMQELLFMVTLKKQGKPVSGASLVLDLSMPDMFMGNNQTKLKEEPSGRYSGRGVIPRCVTGRKTWKAFVTIAQRGQVEQVAFLFEVQ